VIEGHQDRAALARGAIAQRHRTGQPGILHRPVAVQVSCRLRGQDRLDFAPCPPSISFHRSTRWKSRMR
jgi:hypothetical protein